MKVTLQANGRDNQTKTEQIAEKPTEGKWFKVNPLAIDQKLFEEERIDFRQEETRQIILEAFAEMENNLEYAKPFKTMMPKKNWDSKTVGELKDLASVFGDHNANWIEQALEWAQRIANGETWEAVCNLPDTANWHRLVVWVSGYGRLFGGSRKCNNLAPPSCVGSKGYISYSDDYILLSAIPLVVAYE